MLQQMTWMVPLIAFVVAWAVFASRVEGGWVLRVGGGFILGCVMAIVLGGTYNWLFAPLVPKEAAPVKVFAPVPAPTVVKPTLGVSITAATKGLGNVFPLYEDAPLRTGEARKMASAIGAATAAIELIGDPGNLSRTALTIGVSKNADANVVSIMAMRIYLDNLLPDWPDAMVEVTKAMKLAVAQHNASQAVTPYVITRGNKRLEVTSVAELGLVTVAVRPAP